MVGDALGYRAPEAITGYQHVKAGAKYMDDTLGILNDQARGEQALSPEQRSDLIKRYAVLNKKRVDLDEDTRSYTGSARNWNRGRKFHNDAYELHNTTRVSSDEGVARKVEALSRMQATGEQDYRPPGYPYEPIRHPKKHDDDNGNGNYPWVSQSSAEQGSSGYSQQAMSKYPEFPQYPAYGQPQQARPYYPQPTSSQTAHPHPHMTSSQWAHHTAATSTYPSARYPPTSKPPGRR